MTRVSTLPLLLLLCWLLPAQALAQSTETVPVTAEQLSNITRYRYLIEQPLDVTDLLLTLDEQGLLSSPGKEAPIVVFLSFELQRLGEIQLQALLSAVTLDSKERLTVAKALWFAGFNSLAEAQLEPDSPWRQRLQGPAPDLMTWPLTTPADLDAMWAAFISTGDTRYVARIIDAHQHYTSRPEGEHSIEDTLMSGSADWSLRSNARQHELVYRLCVEQADTREGETAALLTAIRDELASPEQSLPNHNGPLSALAAFSADPAFEQQWNELGIDEAPELRATATARRGDLVTLYPLVAGYTLDDELNLHITFDVRITSPDGSIYYEEQDLDFASRRYPSRRHVLLSEGLIRVLFEPDDPFGTYRAELVIHDHIGNISLPLGTEIELVDGREPAI